MRRLATAAVFTLSLTACTATSDVAVTDAPADLASTTIPPTQLDVPVETADEAFCTGLLFSIDSFGDGLLVSEYARQVNMDLEMTWADCMQEFEGVAEEVTRANGVEVDDYDLSTWFTIACTDLTDVWHVQEFGESYALPELVAASCAYPWILAAEAGWESVILRSGVCYVLDFEPSDEQIESGMVPCP